MNLKDFRKHYDQNELDENSLCKNPFDQFNLWLEDAIQQDLLEPNAMILSTVDSTLQCHSRTLLLKEIIKNEGFIFYTNYESNKSTEISFSSKVSLLFLWLGVERQIRIEGIVEKVSSKMSDDYFYSRPIESQIGAIVSTQSKVVSSRKEMESKLEIAQLFYKNNKIERPQNWGGYLLKPMHFEFWQGRPNRLHDRIIFENSNNNWLIKRLWS